MSNQEIPPRARHFDVPNTTDELPIRERAAESCGFHQGQHLADVRAELEGNGGAEGVIRNAIKRIERGDR